MRTHRGSRASAALALAILLTALAIAPATSAAAAPRRVLHVSLYPYIPEAPAAALALKQGFEKTHPDVIVDITFNPKYYSLDPADKGVLYEDADVHEIDVVFLADFVARHKLAALPASLASDADALEPLAAQAATVGGKMVVVPQWMCTDFLIYRADKAGLGDAPTLAQMESALGPDHGLLMNMQGPGALGELYYHALLAQGGDPATILTRITPTPDRAILARLQRILALEPAGFGRTADYAGNEGFYARQFARRQGSAFVGYSELTHDALDETALSCRKQDHCVTADDIRVAAFPIGDGRVRPVIWVDSFGIDAKVDGQKRTDAADFIAYAVSLAAYRSLLIPEDGAPPRYLMPATEAAFDDPQIRSAAPLYPKFRAIMEQGVVVTIPHLSDRLHAVAMTIDAALPQTH